MFTDSLSPAEICFRCWPSTAAEARAERMPTSAWARLVCTTELSRSGLVLPRGILVLRHVDEAVERRAGDAQRHAGRSPLVQVIADMR